ncbi:MAG: DNA primase [Planctomycetota bacterium]|jgi:DNA primase|nr:DNA primase [Planctomycetota bacterium]
MPIYSREFLDRVFAANDIVRLVESYNIPLKRSGASYMGLCPFHNEKTPSFSVNPARQIFNCFGCGAKGGVANFVMQMDHLAFPEAVKRLAELAGIRLEYENPEKAGEYKRRQEKKDFLLWCQAAASDYFSAELATPGGRAALNYLESRGFTREVIDAWHLGWAPDHRDGLAKYLLNRSKEISQPEKVWEYAAEAGLLRLTEQEDSNRHAWDFFRGRLMFPILDRRSRPIGFGGRLLVENRDKGGKYVNSPDSELFHKREVLFGLAQANKEIDRSGVAVIVEGYTDVIMCHQHGLCNVVGVLGTALTPEHVAMLQRQLRDHGKVVAFFDADAAGEKATLRALELFISQDVPLAVAGKLALKDACEFLPLHGAAEFAKLVDQAEDNFDFLLRHFLPPGMNVASLSAAVNQVMRLVNLSPNPVKLALMRRRVAERVGLSEDTLPSKTKSTQDGKPAWLPAAARSSLAPRRENASRAGEAKNADKQDKWRRQEKRLILFMLRQADWTNRVVDVYPPDEWRDQLASQLAGLIRDSWAAGETPNLGQLGQRLVGDASRRLAELADADPTLPPPAAEELNSLLGHIASQDQAERARILFKESATATKKGDTDTADRFYRDFWTLEKQRKAQPEIT